MIITRFAVAIYLVCSFGFNLQASSPTYDFSNAVVVTSPDASPREKNAVRVLVEEVEKRTGIKWEVTTAPPQETVPMVFVSHVKKLGSIDPVLEEWLSKEEEFTKPEGYRVRMIADIPPSVTVCGNDERGVLFGVGHLLRKMLLSTGTVKIREDVAITTAPAVSLRGHQLGYRPKTNSYDAWDVPQWEQYIRELALFGTNAIELLPPRTDDAVSSPHFPRPQMEMMIEMSRIIDQYGLDVWVWYPALDYTYHKEETVEFSLKEWAEVFKKLPRIDAIYVPGGDPGKTAPRYLLPMLERQTASLKSFHPKAEMWVSPQGFDHKWMDEFLGILTTEQPDWLTGVVYGPQVRGNLPELREAVPSKYKIRRYPDITHTRQCQYPVPEWDVAFMFTEGREPINPRPVDQTKIFKAYPSSDSVGFITYSEGCNDDVNKFVWSGLGWNPEGHVLEILRDYSRLFIGAGYEDDFAQGLLTLERNWRGPVLSNSCIVPTLQQFQSMERNASPKLLKNWRFQQALYRAYYDALVKRRVLDETALEEQAIVVLEQAEKIGPVKAMEEAERILDQGEQKPITKQLRQKVFELGDQLFDSIKMQLSVERHQAIHYERGANLDTIDEPLNNRFWFKHRFEEIRKLTDKSTQLKEINAMLNWTNPGPGGFYDDLGTPGAQPHLVMPTTYAKDPEHLINPLLGFGPRGQYLTKPKSWWTHAEGLWDGDVRMRYTELDPHASYRIKIAYAGDSIRSAMRLMANDEYMVHDYRFKDFPFDTAEFAIPQSATADGELNLRWNCIYGRGHNGRGCQVSEVWLMKEEADEK